MADEFSIRAGFSQCGGCSKVLLVLAPEEAESELARVVLAGEQQGDVLLTVSDGPGFACPGCGTRGVVQSMN